jgi:DNA-binding transcriptional MocR family regulator
LLERHDLPVIEDGIYRFLVDEAPLASFAPDHVIFIDSLSKRVAPGLSLGMIAAPPRFAPQITDAIRHGVWMPTGLQAGIARRLLESDLPRKIVAERRQDAARRQAIVRKALSRLAVKGDPRAYHLWLDLPRHWRGEAFAAHLLRHGIGVTAGGILPLNLATRPMVCGWLWHRLLSTIWSGPLRLWPGSHWNLRGTKLNDLGAGCCHTD